MQDQKHSNRPSEGQRVILADGDEVGIVEALVEPPDGNADPLIVVDIAETALPDETDRLYVPQDAVHLVTEGDVVLGTTAPWLAQHHWDAPPPDAE
jgi:hypothetical protein